MPQVPVYSTPQVSPNENLADPRGHATAQAFGAGVGKEISHFGAELEKSSDVLAKHSILMQDRLNAAEAKEHLLAADVELGNLETQFRSLEGKAASAAYPKFVEDVRKLRADSLGNIQNPEIRRQVDQAFTSRLANSIVTGARYTAQQNKRYIVSTNKALIDRAVEDSAEDPDNENRFINNMKILNSGVDSLAQETGMAPEQVTDYKKTLASRAWASRISSVAAGDPAKASEMFEQNKDKLTLVDRQNIESSILKGRTGVDSARTKIRYDTEELVKGDLSSILRTGVGNDKLSKREITAVLGADAAERWEQERAASHDIWKETHDLATMPAYAIAQRMRELIPEPGDPQYDRKMRVLNAFDKVSERVQKLREDDPAASVADDPAVKAASANANYQDLESIQDLSNARIAAQQRAGISNPSPITKDEALKLTAPLRSMMVGQEKSTIQEMAKTFEKLYGDKAPKAFEYALRAHNLDTETAATAANVLRQIGLGQTIPQAETQKANEKADIGASGAATDEITARLGKVPQRAIDYLLANPKSVSEFEGKYGAGVGKYLLDTYRGKRSEADSLELSSQNTGEEPRQVMSDDQLEDALSTIPQAEIDRVRNNPTDQNIEEFKTKYGDDVTKFVLGKSSDEKDDENYVDEESEVRAGRKL